MLFESIELQPRRGRIASLVISTVLHLCVIGTLIILPLVFFDKLPDMQLITFLIQPPDPPPPPPPLPAPAAQARAVHAEYTAPAAIPKSIPPPDAEADIAPVIDPNLISSINIGIPGGVPGGSPSGIVSGILGKQLPLPPPPKPVEPVPVAKRPVKPIFVGGDVQAAKLISQVPITYPELARRARISGVVLLRITVDEEGNVSDVKVVSGHPVLTPAAVETVRKWRYSPTLLNGRPVPVIATVAVDFSLQQQ